MKKQDLHGRRMTETLFRHLSGIDAFHIILSPLLPPPFFILRCLHSRPSFLPFQKQQSIHCLNVALSSSAITDSAERSPPCPRPSAISVHPPVRQVLNDDEEEEEDEEDDGDVVAVPHRKKSDHDTSGPTRTIRRAELYPHLGRALPSLILLGALAEMV